MEIGIYRIKDNSCGRKAVAVMRSIWNPAEKRRGRGQKSK